MPGYVYYYNITNSDNSINTTIYTTSRVYYMDDYDIEGKYNELGNSAIGARTL